MKNSGFRCSMMILLIGLLTLASGRASAQESSKHIELLSYSWGLIPGETARISVTLRRLANPQLPEAPVSARIQLLDTEGGVIAQSDEMRLGPDQIRFWDASRNLIPAAGEPGTGRLQLRTRILITTSSADFDPESLMPVIEVIDGITGKTLHNTDKTFLIFVCDVTTCGSK
jgi:hypothetical protein